MWKRKERAMRTAIAFLVAFQLTTEVTQAQGLERVRFDMFVGVGATTFDSLVTPEVFREAFARGNNVPSDAFLIIQPALMVAPSGRVQAGIEMPLGMAFNPAAPLMGLPYARVGLGDARVFVSALAVSERRFTPSVQTVGFGSLESATLRHLASPAVVGGRVIAYKTISPRFRLGGGAGYADYVRARGNPVLEPLRTWGGMVEVGVSKAWLLNIAIDQVSGAAVHPENELVTGIDDLQANVTFAKFHYGRQRFAFVASAFGLHRDNPLLLVGVRLPILSIGRIDF
jgi:hypothetical protein